MSQSTLSVQFLGAFIGAFLVWLHYFPHWKETADPGLKLAVFATGPAIRNTVMNFISEVIGTFVLMFGILGIKGVTMSRVAQPCRCRWAR